MNGKEVIRKLKAEGGAIIRVRGSHHVVRKNGKSVPIPVHGNKDLGKGIVAEISRETGVKL
jgi:predicted RNA binding protein YcfA (HicA-like mRNA interferase family)